MGVIYKNGIRYGINTDSFDVSPIENSTNGVKSGGVYSALNEKVDKVEGKGLSTNDYTDGDKDKLDGIENGAEANVNPDWDATNGKAKILHKPTSIAGYGITDAYTKSENDTALSALKSAMNLLHDEIPNTVQTYVFTDGSVSQVLHKSGNTTVRTDAFTYATNTITEVRTLNTGESLTIVTNLQTLETTVTYAAV